MKRKNWRIAAVVLAAIFLLSGCGLFGFGKPTAASLAKDAFTNIEKVQSAEMTMNTSGDITATYNVLNIGMNLKLDTDTVMELTRDPERSKGTISLKVGAIGQEQKIDGAFYGDTAEDGTRTTYMQWSGGDWNKHTEAPEQTEEETPGTGPIIMPDSMKQTVGLLKALAEESLTAELKEETVMVNDKEAYQISCMLMGDFLKQMLQVNSTTIDTESIDQLNLNWDEISMPAEIYIYKESKLPARITMDCTSIGAQIVDNMLGEQLEQLPIKDLTLDVTSFTIDITIDRYDEIDPIEIPAEAAGAVETENLYPELTDIIRF